jgi:transcriptional regulator with XRE-family HTH domain
VKYLKKIGDRILELRKQKDMSQKELSDKAQITEASLSRYENNLREPKAEIVGKIAKALDTTTDYLLGINDNPENSNISTTAMHRIDGYEENLPPEAQEELEKFKEYLRHKYRID